LVLTDPPYGVGINYESFDDTTAEVAALIRGFMPLVLRWPVVLLTPGIPAMWAYPPPKWLLAWVHPAAAGGCPWGFSSLNPILAYGPDPYLAKGLGRRDSTLVSAADRKGDDQDHPVAKPVEVWRWLMERGSVSIGDNILDPFLGSGTTLIAAEQLGRRCYGMEIEPKYVDVIVARWEAFTGKKAVLVDG
jgi:tRNA G10  N-methylase Trm11